MAADERGNGKGSARKAALADFKARFGKFPPTVKALGRPLSVHTPNWLAAVTGARFNRVLTLTTTALILGVTAVCATLYYLQADVLGVHPDAWQLIAAGFGLLGVICLASWARLRNGGGGAADAGDGYLIYDEALVHARPGLYTVLRWDELKALEPRLVRANGMPRLVSRDGRWIDLSAKVKGEARLFKVAFERSLANLVPEHLERIAAGEAVKFGSLTLNRQGLGWKGKTLAWSEITSLVLIHGDRNGLEVSAGRFSLLSWCFFEYGTVSNGDVALELVRLLAPPNLLQKP